MAGQNKKPDKVQSNVTAATIKNFSYKKGKVTLNFPINVSDKQQVTDTLECLQAAITDLTKESHVSKT
jgi:hypothetical protein